MRLLEFWQQCERVTEPDLNKESDLLVSRAGPAAFL